MYSVEHILRRAIREELAQLQRHVEVVYVAPRSAPG